MAVWSVLYGRPFTVPQGPSFMQWTSPHPWAVLFSDNHGLFTWAPLLLLSVAGLIGFVRARRDTAHPDRRGPGRLVVRQSAVADWWAGEAFGARRFLSLFPLFVLGLVGVARSRQPVRQALRSRRRVVLVAALVGANLLLLLQYQLALKGHGRDFTVSARTLRHVG